MIISSKIIGQGPVVIILHGLFGEGRNWLSVANELQSNFEVHLIDQRNHQLTRSFLLFASPQLSSRHHLSI